MHNTYLRLNVKYKVTPFDRGFKFDAMSKTDNPLIPDNVVEPCLVLRSSAATHSNTFAEYRTEWGYSGIPCPGIDGYFFDYEVVDGEVVGFVVRDHQ